MALELVKLDSGTLPAIADAIREKTGDTALLLPSQMAAAIAGITGATLPELSAPAEDADVLSGKEYIGKDGDKRTGTLVVCDTLAEVEHFGENGIGLHLDLESSADGSNTAIKLHEPNLMTDNIVVGASIFGVSGAAKTLRVETGTITPAKDITTLELPCTESPNMIVVAIAEESLTEVISQKINAMLYASCTNVACKSGADGSWVDTYRSTCTVHTASGSATYSSATLQLSPNVTLSAANSNFPWRAGCVYKWTAYYWEDSV